MKSSFKQWLDLNRQELVDWYCEGTMVDKDFLTRVEEFAEKAWIYGYALGQYDLNKSMFRKNQYERSSI